MINGEVKFEDLTEDLNTFIFDTEFFTVDENGTIVDCQFEEVVTLGEIEDAKEFFENGEW